MKSETKPSYYFIENLTSSVWLFQVLPYLVKLRFKCGLSAKKIFYVDGSKSGIFFAFITSWLTKVKAEELRFRLIDVKDHEGNLIRLRISCADLARIQEAILKDPIYMNFMSEKHERDCLSVFMEKQVATTSLDGSSMFRVLFLIQLAVWKTELCGEIGPNITIFMDRRMWLKEIIKYGQENKVKVIPVINIKAEIRSLLQNPTLKAFLKRLYKRFTDLKNHQIFVLEKTKNPKLLVEYYGHLNLNHPEMHSDLFFYQQSQLSGKDILVSFSIPYDPIDKKKLDEITRHGMQAIALNPMSTSLKEVPIFDPPKPEKQKIKSGNNKEEKWLTSQANQFAQKKTYWMKFFKENNVKAYIHWYKYDSDHCAKTEALRGLGGVMSIYQRAFEEFPSPETSISADIVFGFSRENALIEKESRSIIPYHVTVGYFGDHRFNLLREQAQIIKNKLEQNGAKHILAFFDENSVPDSRWHTGHEFMRENYAFLLEKVMSEEWLGLIFKPKVPVSLRARLGSVAELLKQAEETGRCIVLEGGALHGSYPPAIAAIASDVTIHGHLCAATAGVEAALAGVPTLLMDREGWPQSKLYKLGKDRVVFNDWQNAWDACLENWKAPNSIQGFGDWTSIIDKIDPFRDGRAAERIGTYLEWIIDGFKNGLTRDTILADAAGRYCKKWGNDKVVEVR